MLSGAKRKRWRRVLAAYALSAGFLFAAPAPGQQAKTPPTSKPSGRTLSREQLDRAIRRGVQSLLRRIAKTGESRTRAYRYQAGGAEALAALAVLEAGGDTTDPKFRALLDRLGKQSSERTAARALRAMVYARRNDTYRRTLQADVQWLVRHRRDDGGWGETPNAPAANTFDTALAMIALGRANRLGVEVPQAVWDGAKRFLASAQNPDGGFGYEGPAKNRTRLRGMSHGSATAAAAILWAVLVDRHQMPPPSNRTGPDWNRFAKTARWLERHYNFKTVPRWYWGDAPEFSYRALLLLAAPSLRTSRPEWSYLPGQLAALLLDLQQPAGHWRGQPLAENDAIATAWAVLTLCRARQELQSAQPAPTKVAQQVRPRLLLVIGRIHHAGDWNVFPRAEEQWSYALAGAVSVGLQRQDVFAGQDYNPAMTLVHLTGTRLEGFGAPARSALRAYLQRGGMVLIDPAGGGKLFFEQAKAMLEQAFGSEAVVPLPSDSPLLTGRFAGDVGSDVSRVRFTPTAAKRVGKPQGPPRLWGVRQGDRIVAVLSEFSLTAPSAGPVPEGCAGYAPDDAKRIALNVLLYTYAARQQALK